MKSWIYFARYGEHGPIKIGRGDNPRRRVADLNVGTPAQLILLDGMLSDQAVEEEDELHDRLRAFHVRGEWYDAEIVLEEMKRLGSRLVGADQISECQLENPWSKSKNLNIRATPEEVELWRTAASTQNKSLSEWVRDALNPFAADPLEEKEDA